MEIPVAAFMNHSHEMSTVSETPENPFDPPAVESEIGRQSQPELAHPPLDPDNAVDSVEEVLTGEIEVWERALRNRSTVIRKQAARKLKQLTGKDYDY
jgi:hypothetical protein